MTVIVAQINCKKEAFQQHRYHTTEPAGNRWVSQTFTTFFQLTTSSPPGKLSSLLVVYLARQVLLSSCFACFSLFFSATRSTYVEFPPLFTSPASPVLTLVANPPSSSSLGHFSPRHTHAGFTFVSKHILRYRGSPPVIRQTGRKEHSAKAIESEPLERRVKPVDRPRGATPCPLSSSRLASVDGRGDPRVFSTDREAVGAADAADRSDFDARTSGQAAR